MMLDPTELKKKYDELVETTSDSVNEDSALVMFKTEWVRILLVPPVLETPPCIEIEVSPPIPSSSSSSGLGLDGRDEDAGNCSESFLQDMIAHMAYLTTLLESGFSVDFTGNGSLFIAFRRFAEKPDIDTFRLLLPPSSGSDRGRKGPTRLVTNLVI
jgi:hypothetical protein